MYSKLYTIHFEKEGKHVYTIQMVAKSKQEYEKDIKPEIVKTKKLYGADKVIITHEDMPNNY